MKKLSLAALVSAATVTATPAMAATLLYEPGQNYAEQVHNTGAAPGNPVTLTTTPSGYEVLYSADATITPNGGGFAQQDGPFGWLEIDPLLASVSKIGVTLTPDDDIRFNTTFDVLVTFVGGGTQLLSGVLPNHGKVDIWAEGQELIDKIRITNLAGASQQQGSLEAGELASVRQTSFDVGSVVPEPATWAMLIAGFGATGAALRRRRIHPARTAEPPTERAGLSPAR